MFQFFALSFLILASLSFAPLQAAAIRHVGGGGGISEQNLVFAFENTRDLLQFCSRDCQLSKENFDSLRAFVQATANPKAILYFRQSGCTQSELQGPDWNVCAKDLDRYDLNQDGLMDLKESSLMLFQLFASFQGLASDSVSVIIHQLEHLLTQKSFNHIFSFSDSLEFQIFGFEKEPLTMPSIYIQTDGFEALQIDSELRALSTCSEVQLMRPYYALNETKGKLRKVVMVFPIMEYCGSDSVTGVLKKRMLEFNFERGSIKLQR